MTHSTMQEETLDCTNGGEHEWEKVEYDPSVGVMGSDRVCVICGKFEEDDSSGDFDDNYL